MESESIDVLYLFIAEKMQKRREFYKDQITTRRSMKLKMSETSSVKVNFGLAVTRAVLRCRKADLEAKMQQDRGRSSMRRSHRRRLLAP